MDGKERTCESDQILDSGKMREWMRTDGAFDRLLEEVSRSFYLTLRWLPVAVRRSLSLAYLLARASDSIADAEATSVGSRREMLEKMVSGRCEKEDFLFFKDAVTRGEWRLLCVFPWLLEEVGKSEDRWEVDAVWKTILSGQIFDLVRFDGKDVVPLDKEERDRYTYLVAGCVGEFWTKLCAKKLPHFSREALPDLLKKADAFGRGLQLVNMLRDRVRDTRAGRVYVREDEVGDCLMQTRYLLDEGRKYVLQVRHRRLRIACLLPLVLAERTLKLVENHPGVENLKISRKEVRTWVVLSALAWISPKISSWVFRKAGFSNG